MNTRRRVYVIGREDGGDPAVFEAEVWSESNDELLVIVGVGQLLPMPPDKAYLTREVAEARLREIMKERTR